MFSILTALVVVHTCINKWFSQSSQYLGYWFLVITILTLSRLYIRIPNSHPNLFQIEPCCEHIEEVPYQVRAEIIQTFWKDRQGGSTRYRYELGYQTDSQYHQIYRHHPQCLRVLWPWRAEPDTDKGSGRYRVKVSVYIISIIWLTFRKFFRILKIM